MAVSALAVHGVMTGVLNSTQRYRLNQFDLLVPDGQPVRWALAMAAPREAGGSSLRAEFDVGDLPPRQRRTSADLSVRRRSRNAGGAARHD